MSQELLRFDGALNCLFFSGEWRIGDIDKLELQWQILSLADVKAITIDAMAIEHLDSAGALFLQKTLDELHEKNIGITDFIAPSNIKSMLSLIKTIGVVQPVKQAKNKHKSPLYVLGEICEKKLSECMGFINLLGELAVYFYRALINWHRFRFASIVDVIDKAGIRALPILALLASLIGVVLTYQMGLQLKTYGVNIYIVYYCGIALQREFAPLITAIIVAGRTSSAFTAQLGSMKINEELDALTTMGLSPTEFLILPKIIGLFVVFPLLVFWADVFGTLGSMLMSKLTLGVGYVEYVQYLKQSLGVDEYLLGLAKAPVFALIIALVGCYQGLMVQDNANSVGFFTTKSVVQAIFLIIVADAMFSFLYTWLDI